MAIVVSGQFNIGTAATIEAKHVEIRTDLRYQHDVDTLIKYLRSIKKLLPEYVPQPKKKD